MGPGCSVGGGGVDENCERYNTQQESDAKWCSPRRSSCGAAGPTGSAVTSRSSSPRSASGRRLPFHLSYLGTSPNVPPPNRQPAPHDSRVRSCTPASDRFGKPSLCRANTSHHERAVPEGTGRRSAGPNARPSSARAVRPPVQCRPASGSLHRAGGRRGARLQHRPASSGAFACRYAEALPSSSSSAELLDSSFVVSGRAI